MEYAYSIAMGVLAVALWLYAGVMALTKDYKMLHYRTRASVEPKDPQRYTAQLAKVIALVAVAPAVSAVVGIWHKIAAAVVLGVLLVALICLGTLLMRKATPPDKEDDGALQK